MMGILKSRLVRVTSNKAYLPEVDGLRFFSISLVLLFHIYGYFHLRFDQAIIGSGATYSVLNNTFINGDRGVQLFFVLSGFILCLPFAQSFKKNVAQPDIKKYYLRRLTRLEPPYIIAMSLFFIAALIMYNENWKLLLSSFFASLVYVHNLVFKEPSYINVVAWSLEVEVQFYLIAPLLFQLFRLSSFWRRLIIVIATAAILYSTYYYFPGYITLFHQLPYFLMGMLLADWYVHDQYNDFFSDSRVIVFAIVMFLLILYLPWKTAFYGAVLFPIAIFLFYYSVLKNGFLKAVFSFGWIPIIGGMCYSIYLIHYPIISLAGRATVKLVIGHFYLVNLLVQFSLLITAILTLSTVFYLLVERPFMSSGWKWGAFKNKITK